MEQIYRDRHEDYEVFTTVFSPQVCRARTRTRRVDSQKVRVQVSFRGRSQRELDLDEGDEVEVLFRVDPVWSFGRRTDGTQGYFPSACVTQEVISFKATPPLIRRSSVPVVTAASTAPCGCTSGHNTPKQLRKHSLLRPLGLSPSPGLGPACPGSSPSLLHRVLDKSRRKSCPLLQQDQDQTELGLNLD